MMTNEAKYREMLIWTAQTIHNAYHLPGGTWRSCPNDVCDSIARFLNDEYVPWSRPLA